MPRSRNMAAAKQEITFPAILAARGLMPDDILIRIPGKYGSTDRFRPLVSGHAKPYDENTGEFTAEARLVAIALGEAPEKLFDSFKAEMKAAKVSGQNQKRFAWLVHIHTTNLHSVRGSGDAYIGTTQLFRQHLQKFFEINRIAEIDRLDVYAGLYEGSVLPLRNGRICREAIQLMHWLSIPSDKVCEKIPEIKKDLIFTDLLRQQLPNLAAFMLHHNACTCSALSDFAAERGIPLQDGFTETLWKSLNTRDTQALRANGPLLAKLEDLFGEPRAAFLSATSTKPALKKSNLKPRLSPQMLRTLPGVDLE